MFNIARRRSRRGNYAIMLAGGIVALLAFGAISIDISYLRLADSQAQDVADASSQAALLVLRTTGDTADATAAAYSILDKNPVAGQSATLEEIEFGTWDDDSASFVTGLPTVNAVKVDVARQDDNAVGLFLARIFGRTDAPVYATATSAARNLHVCLAMDITNSWNRPDFYYSRDAALAFLDTMQDAYGPEDMVGMSIFTGRYAWEYTPLTYVEDEVNTGAARADWEVLETASKAGVYNAGHAKGCNVYGTSSPNRDNFDLPSPDGGGCFPWMPREWLDEPGTDHTTGIEMCNTMLTEANGPTVYNVMVVMTDGYPNGTSSGNFEDRIADGYVEDRWREYQADVPHSTSQVKADSVALTQDMYSAIGVQTFVVSFVADDSFMEDMTTGQGYYVNTSDASKLVDIFRDIAESLPLALVQ